MRRIGLGVFFASVAVNAVLGIYAVLAPDFGETQGKILGTSLCVTGAALLALACEPAWERRLLGSAPYLGTALGAVGFGLAIGGIWAEAESDTFLRVMASAFTIAVVCTVASLLVLSRPAPGHEWVFAATFGLLVLAGAAITVAIWLADEGPGRALGSMWTIVGAAAVATLLARARLSRGHEWVLAVTFGLLTLGAALFAIVPWYLRTMGVILIALAAFTVTVPVLHWIDRAAIAGAESASGEIRRCPYCGSSVAGEAGVTLACRRCGRAFMVTGVESPSSANLT
jgi:hypothetical protein